MEKNYIEYMLVVFVELLDMCLLCKEGYYQTDCYLCQADYYFCQLGHYL